MAELQSASKKQDAISFVGAILVIAFLNGRIKDSPLLISKPGFPDEFQELDVYYLVNFDKIQLLVCCKIIAIPMWIRSILNES